MIALRSPRNTTERLRYTLTSGKCTPCLMLCYGKLLRCKVFHLGVPGSSGWNIDCGLATCISGPYNSAVSDCPESRAVDPERSTL